MDDYYPTLNHLLGRNFLLPKFISLGSLLLQIPQNERLKAEIYVFFHSSKDWKSKIKVSAGLVSSDGSFLGL